MLKTRIIPCLDVDNGRVVKGINFVSLKDAGDPVEQATIYSKEGADEIAFLDINYIVNKSISQKEYNPIWQKYIR